MIKKIQFLFILVSSLIISSDPEDKIIHVVKPLTETPQVITKGDAADDPAIWVNNISLSDSLVFGH